MGGEGHAAHPGVIEEGTAEAGGLGTCLSHSSSLSAHCSVA